MDNPYSIDEQTVFELRDSRGRYASPSKAKRFYIYHLGKLIYAGEFDRINLPVSEKEDVIINAMQEAFQAMPAKKIARKKSEQKKAVEKHLQESLAEDLYEDLLEIVIEEDPELLEELAEAEKDDEDELADFLFRDLLDLISEEDPYLFEEITGEELPLGGTITEWFDQFASFSLGDVRNHEIAYVQKIQFDLDVPVITESPDYQDMIEIFENHLLYPLRKVYDMTIEGHDLFLFSMIYDIQLGADIEMTTKGWGIARVEAKSWEEFKGLIIDSLYIDFRKKYRKYLLGSFDNSMIIKGFFLENIYETESGVI